MLHDKLMKKLGSKNKKLDPLEQHAKADVVKALSSQAGDIMGSKLGDGLSKKVTVASDSPEGLDAGLKKAHDLIHTKSDMSEPDGLGEEGEGAEEDMGLDLDHDDEQGEPKSHVDAMAAHGYKDAPLSNEDHDHLSPDELDAKIAHLMAVKKQKMGHNA